MAAAKRIVPSRCCGVLIDVQTFFLSQVDNRHRARLKTNTISFLRLLDHFRVPVVVTLERPVDQKGVLSEDIAKHLGERTRVLEKDFFDLCRETEIERHLSGLKIDQAIVAGCETDVCVLQSCLGLLERGYQVYVVEDLIFSSARDVDAAMARMRAEGVVFLSYKTLYYELLEAVGGPPGVDRPEAIGPLPDDLADTAV
jgi:nicotinamidase-related amidase